MELWPAWKIEVARCLENGIIKKEYSFCNLWFDIDLYRHIDDILSIDNACVFYPFHTTNNKKTIVIIIYFFIIWYFTQSADPKGNLANENIVLLSYRNFLHKRNTDSFWLASASKWTSSMWFFYASIKLPVSQLV